MKTVLTIGQWAMILFVALISSTASYAATPAAASAVITIDEESFSCIREMTPVRHFYVDNLLGDIEGTLAAANSPEGAVYPTGSVVQLVPTEVMVKREPGTFMASGDWEFFELEVNEGGSSIVKRGFVDVVNRFGGNCFACHAPAKEKWDFICESGHGCEPIPINHKMTGALQRSDPRCGPAVLEPGDTMALIKLKAMISIGLTKKWLEDLF
ncbi:conserved exported protein of unknown function [Shewanella benthica]|uniref:Cytochrome P460 domain-containing protein n=1 Tax=Shewanella benthica TaxID=43661 RepID=A0A330M5F2_9GAMM|nr:hypothetical protein [Shewanella benthica]SQH74987.1 conserved exported protein of unknown function [Shewanella benthica]